MTFVPNVQGSKELAVPLIVQKTTVYVKKNIHKVETEDNIEIYEWDEYQYDKDEWIETTGNELENLRIKDLENKMALAEIYELVINKE